MTRDVETEVRTAYVDLVPAAQTEAELLAAIPTASREPESPRPRPWLPALVAAAAVLAITAAVLAISLGGRAPTSRVDGVPVSPSEPVQFDPSEYVTIAKQMIDAKVRQKDVRINDALAFIRKDLGDDSFAELARRLKARDPKVTPEQARALWDARSRATEWSTAKYGSGSFLIEPPSVQAPPSDPRVTTPKPPTRDGWWEKASPSIRSAWVFAAYVEKSGLFDVDPQRDKENCDACGGAGLISKVLSSGQPLTYLCPRCGGSRYDLTVHYR